MPDPQPPDAFHYETVVYPRPAVRKLRAYAFDPQSSTDLETATVNNSIITLPWEAPWERPVTPGPCGEYIEVIDHDPASGLFYQPVDLNDPLLLAQDGLPPSEGRPQFHQQMVYAVAMKTVRNFERALGRLVYWTRETRATKDLGKTYELALRLRIYPHAIREKNAYYSPEKTAILFGYFRPPNEEMGDRWIFSCLSQDIIAHETTHALLHGVHRRSIQASNLDTLAFHEGFADIVALLQHFTMTDVLRQQIAHSRGDLRSTGLLNSLAGQFGRAISRQRGPLRAALDLVARERQADSISDGEAREKELAGTRLSDTVREAHARGGFLVAAVFDAFAMIYERRTADLMRLAFGGHLNTGAELPADLVNRLASEASKAADHVLRMCVRALDYAPPVDMTFGEYLRAIITADADLVPNDPLGYRVAFAQAFRRRGIMPSDSLSMSPDSLVWEKPDPAELPNDPDTARGLFRSLLPKLQLVASFGIERNVDFFEVGSFRKLNAKIIARNQKAVHTWLELPSDQDPAWERLLGVKLIATHLKPPDEPPLRSIPRKEAKDRGEVPIVQVYSARVARRTGPDGEELSQFVIQIVQKRRGYLRKERQDLADQGKLDDPPDFWFRGGATVLVDLRDGQLRYTIRKSIWSDIRLEQQRQFELNRRGMLALHLYPSQADTVDNEPFALIHRS